MSLKQNPNLTYKVREVIQKIRELYIPEYGKYFMEETENP